MAGQDKQHWQGYVCPSCRLLLKAPFSLKGGVGVCPSCTASLNFPTDEDAIAPVYTENKMWGVKGLYDAVVKRDRSLPEWEAHGVVDVGGRQAQSGMWYIMLPLAVIGAVIVAVLFSMLSDDGGAEGRKVVELETVNAVKEQDTSPEQKGDKPIDEIKLSALLKQFTDARTVEEVMSVIRDEGDLAEKLQKHYPEGWVKCKPYVKVESLQRVMGRPWLITAECKNEDGVSHRLVVVEQLNGELKIDWEAMVGYTSPWEKIKNERSTQPVTVRALSSVSNFYNYEFNEREWQAFELINPNQDVIFTGYARRDGDMIRKLQPIGYASKKLPIIVKIRYPENGQSASQVIIEDVVDSSWVNPLQ